VDSFKELRALGLSSYRFPDMHDIGDMCIDAGFSNPVVDTEYITLDYEDLAMLLREVKLVAHGAANAPSLRQRLTKSEALKLRQLYNLPHKLTLEIFVAHGWKDQSRIDLPPGQSVINFKR
jgi:malonyl-CoA O-methyltransferase